MRKNTAKKLPESKPADDPKPHDNIVGKVTLVKLADVAPNSWNPNVMTAFERESLKFGLQTDGWLSSQALLIWGTDEKKNPKNVIIDGEHRWTVATELGFKKGPMVFLDGVTEAQAKALTLKMNAKRGKFSEASLGEVVRSIQEEIGPDIALNLGIEQDRIMKFLAVQEEVTVGPVGGEPEGAASAIVLPSGKATHTKMVQLFFSPEEHEEFSAAIQKVAEKVKVKDISEAVLVALRQATSKK